MTPLRLAVPFAILCAAAPAQALDAKATAAIEKLRARDDVPGLPCAIGVRGEIVFARGFGLADAENDVAATPATVYRLASISKPVTAVLAMRLAERGLLALDRDVHE